MKAATTENNEKQHNGSYVLARKKLRDSTYTHMPHESLAMLTCDFQ